MEGYNLDMTPYYTRTGDDGFTGLLGEGRVPKYHPRLETVGALDEATAALGVARAACLVPEHRLAILAVQKDLYHLMAEVSATEENASRFRKVDQERVAWLETQVEAAGETVDAPKEFIVPGDSASGAALALARTIVRRAERLVAEQLHAGEIENNELLRYLNRLSSLLFVMELGENAAAGIEKTTLAKSE
jgi:cob(I)alamin adenosyltransferase